MRRSIAVLAVALLPALAACRTSPAAPRSLLAKPAAPPPGSDVVPGAVYRADVVRARAPLPRPWDVAPVGGVVVLEGDGTGSDGEPYGGLDVSRRIGSSLALVGTWRLHGARLERRGGASRPPESTDGPGTTPTGSSTAWQRGRIHHLAALLAWEAPDRRGERRTALRLAAGPELFATDGFDQDDQGPGGLAEASLLLRMGDRAHAGIGATAHAFFTDAGGGESRWLAAFAGTLTLRLDL